MIDTSLEALEVLIRGEGYGDQGVHYDVLLETLRVVAAEKRAILATDEAALRELFQMWLESRPSFRTTAEVEAAWEGWKANTAVAAMLATAEKRAALLVEFPNPSTVAPVEPALAQQEQTQQGDQ